MASAKLRAPFAGPKDGDAKIRCLTMNESRSGGGVEL